MENYKAAIDNLTDESHISAAMCEKHNRLRRCCFTGHRPEKLSANSKTIKASLAVEIDAAIADGITEFITGMARGVDMWAAELILARRAANPDITLFCAIPYEGFEKKWSDAWRNLYRSILAQANHFKVFHPRFTYSSFQERNRWMVDHSERVIAVFNGEKGGTKNTLDYARKAGLRIFILEG